MRAFQHASHENLAHEGLPTFGRLEEPFEWYSQSVEWY